MYTESIARTKMINTMVEFNGTRSKNVGMYNVQHMNPVNIVKNNPPRNQVNGVHILYKYINPVIVIIKALMVVLTFAEISN